MQDKRSGSLATRYASQLGIRGLLDTARKRRREGKGERAKVLFETDHCVHEHSSGGATLPPALEHQPRALAVALSLCRGISIF